MSRHARRENSGEQHGQGAGDYRQPVDDDPFAADYAAPSPWPPEDLTGQEPGAADGWPRAAPGRHHARPDARAADLGRPGERPRPPRRARSADQNQQPEPEPYRWTPDTGSVAPDPYVWLPEDSETAGYRADANGHRGGASDAGRRAGYDVPAGHEATAGYDVPVGHEATAGYDVPVGYDAPADYDASVGHDPVSYDNRAARHDTGAAAYRGDASSYLDAPPSRPAAAAGYGAAQPGFGGEAPGHSSGPDYGQATSGYVNGMPLATGPPWDDDTDSGPLPPLPPPSMPGPGHPSGPLPPLPPLPPSELAWRQSLADPVLAEPGTDPPAPDSYGDGTYPDSAATGHPGYQAYGDDPRDRRAGVTQEAREYPDAGGWYRDVEEPQAWVQDEESGFLPGLDDSRSARRRAASGPGDPARKRRKRGRRAVLVAGMVILLIVVAVLGVGYSYWRKYYQPPDFSGPGTGTAVAQIMPGESAATVGQRLADLGVVASERAFALAAKNSSQGTALEPGYYRLHKHMKASLAFALLLQPSTRLQTKITIPEGYRLSQIIAALGKQTGNLKGYQQAAAQTTALGLPSFAKGNPEGYLFPATYEIQPNTPPLAVMRNMILRFDQEAAAVNLPAESARAQLTQEDVIIVASLIQAEGKRPQDLPKIARVIYNRLNMTPPMDLQLDTTVLYALHSFAGDVTIQQTQVNSAYNTYLHAGLPPGPIDSPGDAAIQAALHPAAGNWTYFLTVNPKTGLTLFTNSFTDFQNFQAQLAQNTKSG